MPCGWQARFWGTGVPLQLRAPPELPWSLTSTRPEGCPLASTLQEPAQSQWNQRPVTTGARTPTLTRAFQGPMNSALLSQPPKMTRELVLPVSCRRCQLPLASAPGRGRGRRRRWVSSRAPWASDIIFWGAGGGRRRGGVLWRVWGLQEGRRARGGLGLGHRPGGVSHQGRVLGTPSLGAPGPIFQSVEKYCEKNLQGGAGPRPGGQTGRSGRGPPNASLLG